MIDQHYVKPIASGRPSMSSYTVHPVTIDRINGTEKDL